MTKKEEQMKRSVAQFCHAIGNSMQPEDLLLVAKHLEEVREQIDLRDDIIRGLLKAGESIEILDPDDANIQAIKELVNYNERKENV